MAKNNTNKIFSQETAEQHGFKPAYALNDGTGREVWVRGNSMNKQSIYVKPSPKMTTLSDYAFEKPNGEREYMGPKGKIPMFEEDIKRMVEESVKRVIKETHENYIWDLIDELKEALGPDELINRICGRLDSMTLSKMLNDIKEVELNNYSIDNEEE